MAESPEELAYQLSRETFEAQARTEVKLRERATGLLQAASLVIPVAGIAVSKGPRDVGVGVAIPLGLAAVSYVFVALFCGKVLLPRYFGTGIAGSRFLETAREYDATLTDMYETAAKWLDETHDENDATLNAAGGDIRTAIVLLAAELALLAASLVVSLLG